MNIISTIIQGAVKLAPVFLAWKAGADNAKNKNNSDVNRLRSILTKLRNKSSK